MRSEKIPNTRRSNLKSLTNLNFSGITENKYIFELFVAHLASMLCSGVFIHRLANNQEAINRKRQFAQEEHMRINRDVRWVLQGVWWRCYVVKNNTEHNDDMHIARWSMKTGPQKLHSGRSGIEKGPR